LQKTFDCANLELYHGSAAFNLTQYPEWDSMLWELVALPNQVLTVHAKRRGRGHGGWSKDNPYLEEQRFVEFDIDIEPPALAQRILSVREQIAREWTSDLETLRVANEMILDSYHAFQAHQRFSETASSSTSSSSKTRDKVDRVPPQPQEEDPENLGAVDPLTAPYYYSSSAAYDKNFKAYDRTAMMVLGNNIVHDGHSSSAYRAGSFDLLGLLATQESVHRILKLYHTKRQQQQPRRRGSTQRQRVTKDDEDDNDDDDDEVDATRDYQSSAEWLHQFYVARLSTHFDGNQEYGRADDFLEELLLSPPSVKVTARTGELGLIDPLRMAEDIIAMRSQVAMDWKETVRVAPMDHTELRNMCLALRMMGQTNKREQQSLQPKLPLTSTSATSSALEETTTTTSSSTGAGAPQHMEEFQ
jgi:hypothetical protein